MVAQLVEAWRYKKEDCGSIPHGVMALGSTQGLIEMSTWGRGLTTLQPSCAGCLEFWEPQPPGGLRTCTGIALLFMAQTVSRRSFTARNGLDSRPVHARFTVNKVAKVYVFYQYFHNSLSVSSNQYSISHFTQLPSMLYHLSSSESRVDKNVSLHPSHSFLPLTPHSTPQQY